MSLADFAESVRQTNPIDVMEALVAAHEWPFEREEAHELTICIAGSWCDYNLAFEWRSEVQALIVGAVYDFRAPAHRRNEVYRLIAMLNREMWLGHFEIEDDGAIGFRHALPLAGGAEATTEQCDVLLRAGVDACERYYPAFQFLLWGGKTAQESLNAAMLDCQGAA